MSSTRPTHRCPAAHRHFPFGRPVHLRDPRTTFGAGDIRAWGGVPRPHRDFPRKDRDPPEVIGKRTSVVGGLEHDDVVLLRAR
ncbi:hypothetical protein GCM10017772_40740 [Promicromonospora soli]|uniref:Uncharacterized protein n=1 Tax=Promicromonospora soli TaxID=2035533 RepID=A0A919G4T2_9MICO|nr:hypothetical protein GCM10017772_40740 [Promicromonospora soli]